MGQELRRAGWRVRFLASAFTSGFLLASAGGNAGEVDVLSGDPHEDRRRRRSLLADFRPRFVVFADYPLLYLSTQGRALLDEKGLALGDLRDLDDIGAEPVTLDHLGMAQGPMMLHFGPPHLEPFGEHLPAMPERMKILLPCPVQSPQPPSGVRGVPFRYWPLPLERSVARRSAIRRRFAEGEDGLLVFHSVPSWAQELCRRHALPQYDYLTGVLETYFEEIGRPVTLLSVNHGSLLTASSAPWLRVVNLCRLSPREYQELLFASDLMLTDNGVSVSLGKAVCGLVPCAVLRNSHRLLALLDSLSPLDVGEQRLRQILLDMEGQRPGAVFPFEAFPIWNREDLEALRLFDGNPLTGCVATLELYGGEETRQALRSLLIDPARREELQSRQLEYVAALRALPDPEAALRALTS